MDVTHRPTENRDTPILRPTDFRDTAGSRDAAKERQGAPAHAGPDPWLPPPGVALTGGVTTFTAARASATASAVTLRKARERRRSESSAYEAPPRTPNEGPPASRPPLCTRRAQPFPLQLHAMRLDLAGLPIQLLRGLFVTLLYVLGARLGLAIAAVTEQASPVWIPTGVAIWATFRFGPRILPFVFLGGLIGSLSSGSPLPPSLFIGAGNTLEAWLAATLLRRHEFRENLARVRDVLVLWLAGGVAAAGASALIGVGSLLAFERTTLALAPKALWVWWLGDAMGALVVAPFLFAFLPAARAGHFRGKGKELLSLTLTLVAVCLVVFGRAFAGEEPVFSQGFLLFPVAVWAALRFGPPGAAFATCAMSTLTVLATAIGRGPFVAQVALEGVVVLQLFVAVLALTALLLAAVSTQRQVAEQQLVASERLVSVGILAAGVGHEINNPLTFVISNLELLERELPRGNERAREMLRDAQFGADRVRGIVGDLRVFGRDNATLDEAVSLDAVVGSAIRLAGREVASRGRLTSDLGDPPPVAGSQAQLGQVVLNLLLNAAQALPETGGSIRISTGTAPDGRALLEVEDDGCGIPKELHARIFAPFFTTKPVGQGTGLGLSICQKIVADHRGELSVRSEPGKGTTFRVLLPALPRPTPQEAAPPADAPTQRRGRVLIVDDEVRLAQSMRLLLEPEHEVKVLHSGEEALDALLGGEGYDVVFCDLHMPGLSGMDVHRRLQAEAPQIASSLIFFSGGAYTDEARSFVQAVGNTVLEKPVRPGRLLEMVQRALR